MSSGSPLAVGELARVLDRHGVDYVVIGGVAMQAHGHVRTTQDFDVVAAWTPENTARLAGALRELGAQLRGVDAQLLGIELTDPAELYNAGNLLMDTSHGDLDVFAVDQTSGAPVSYEDLRARAVRVELGSLTLLVAHPEDLIRMKTAAAEFRDRPDAKRRQDREDIAVLERLIGEERKRRAQMGAPDRAQPPSHPSAYPSSRLPPRRGHSTGR